MHAAAMEKPTPEPIEPPFLRPSKRKPDAKLLLATIDHWLRCNQPASIRHRALALVADRAARRLGVLELREDAR